MVPLQVLTRHTAPWPYNLGVGYVLALKDSHRTLRSEVKLFFEALKAHRLEEMTYTHHQQVDDDHGCLVIRGYWLTSDIEYLGVKSSWAQIMRIGLVENRFETGGMESRLGARFVL